MSVSAPSILINFSGGLDATYCLIKYLKENPPGSVLAHFCYRHTTFGQRYADISRVQADKIINKLKEKYEFKYITSSYIAPKNAMHAVQLLGFLTTQLVNQYSSIDRVVISASNYDLLQGSAYDDRVRGRNRLLSTYMNRTNITLEYPIAVKSRSQLYTELDNDYKLLVFSCMDPTQDENDLVYACHRCSSCLSSPSEYNKRKLI